MPPKQIGYLILNFEKAKVESMGAVKCEIHDISGLMWVCQHIDEYILSMTDPNKLAEKTNTKEINTATIRELTLVNVLLAYCDKCAEKHRLPLDKVSQASLLTIHLPSLLAFKKETVGECIDCFYKEVFNVELGEDDKLPFLNTTRKVNS